MTFRIGQKVVCIDTSPWNARDYAHWLYPKLRQVGTISGFYSSSENGTLCVTLAEFPNRHDQFPGFYAWRFRPVAERKTSIEVFTALLVPSKQGVEA